MGAIERAEDVIPGFRYKDSRITLALPNAKFGVAFQGDKVSDLVDDGWKIERLTTHDLNPFLRVFDICDDARIALEKRKMDPNVKMTSQPEEVVLHEIMRRMLPVPDRNYKFTREDGTELTTPDFTWEKYKIAFFLDGSYWHSIKGNKEIIKKIKADKKRQNDIVIQRSDKARKDGQIRSELGSMGWIVLSCTDGDVETQDGVNRVVDLIERTINNVQISSQVQVNNTTTQEEDDLFSSLLNPVEESRNKNEDAENTHTREYEEEDKGESSETNESESNVSENLEDENIDTTEIEKEESHQNKSSNTINANLTQNDDLEDNHEKETNNKNNLRGSIFDYIGDYEHEESEVNVEDTNNYSPPGEEILDVTEVAESNIDIHKEIPDESFIPMDSPDENPYEDYDLLDDVFLDKELEDIFFINEDDDE